MNSSSKVFAATLMIAATTWLAAPAVAAPISSSVGLQNAAETSIETVQYRRGWRGGSRGRGVGAGIVAGAIIGGAILGASQPYGYGYGGYGPGYGYAPGYAYAPGYNQGYAGGNEIAYCQQRFRSYDPSSGTYLGFDGLRHSCP